MSIKSQPLTEPEDSLRCVQNVRSPVPILNHINPVHTLPPCFPKVHFNIIFQLKTLYLPIRLSKQHLYTFLISFIRTTCTAYLKLFDLIILYYLLKSKIYERPRSGMFSSLLPFHPSCGQIFSSALCSQPRSVCVLSLMRETSFHTRADQQEKI